MVHRPRFTRINCCIIGCRCGSTLFPSGELICGKHWRTIRKETRRRQRIAEKEFARQEALDAAPRDGLTAQEWKQYQRAHRLVEIAWRRCKAEANARAVGL